MTDVNHYFISSILGARIEAGSRHRFGFLGATQTLAALQHGIKEAKPEETELPPDSDARIAQAFEMTRAGYSPDVVLSTPALSTAFFKECKALGVLGPRSSINRRLLRFRKSPPPGIKLKPTTRESDAEPAPYVYAAEIAAAQMRYQHGATIDDLLISADVASEFVALAQSIQGRGRHLDYVTAALHVRKNRKPAKAAWLEIEQLKPGKVLRSLHAVADFASLKDHQVPEETGLFMITEQACQDRALYVGAGKCLRADVAPFMNLRPFLALGNRFWTPDPKTIWLSVAPMVKVDGVGIQGWQCRLISDLHPVFNYPVKEVA